MCGRVAEVDAEFHIPPELAAIYAKMGVKPGSRVVCGYRIDEHIPINALERSVTDFPVNVE